VKVVILEEGADLDALSCAYGVLLLYQDAYLLKPSLLSRRASEVFKRFKERFRLLEKLPQEFDLVLVDAHHVEEYRFAGVKEFTYLTIIQRHPKGSRERWMRWAVQPPWWWRNSKG